MNARTQFFMVCRKKIVKKGYYLRKPQDHGLPETDTLLSKRGLAETAVTVVGMTYSFILDSSELNSFLSLGETLFFDTLNF